MNTFVPPLHTHTLKQYKDEFDDFCAKYELYEETSLNYFINGLSTKIKGNVIMFNPKTVNVAYKLAKN